LPLFAPQYQKILSDSLGELSNNTNFTRLSAGGKVRALLETQSRRLKEVYDTFDLNLARAYVSAAQGQYLDLIGALLGAARSKASTASVSSEMLVQKFYVETGTFGDINSNRDILITQGTIISSQDEENGTKYRLINSILLSADDSEGFVAIEATNPGTEANVGSNSLVFHSFTSYTDVDNNSLLTTNFYPIVNGKDYESDANYKFRIVNRTLEAEAANVTAIRLAGLSVAGVADIIVKRRYRGIGTFAVIIQSTTPTVSNPLIAGVRGKVEEVMAAGEYTFVMGPKEIGLTMRTTVFYKKKLVDDEIDTIETDLVEAITSYVNSLDIGEEFSINLLISNLFSVSDDIRNFGVSGTPIEELYVYKNSKLEDNRVRQKLLGDYVAADDERIIIETTVSNPIVFIRKYI